MSGWRRVALVLALLAAGIIFGVLLTFYTLHLSIASFRSAQVYFPERNELFLVPVARFTSKPLTPQLLFMELEKGPRDKNALLPALPPGGMSAQVSTRGQTILVDFKEPPPLRKWPLLLASLLATFKQLPDYDAVEFLVNGKINVVAGEEELGREVFRDFWINDNLKLSGDRVQAGEERKVIVYYLLKGSSYLVPVTLHFPAEVSVLEGVARALEDNPGIPWALQSPLPEGTEITSVSRPADNIVEMSVNFKGSKRKRALAEKAILLSFGGIPGVEYVRIRPGSGFFSWRPLQKKPVSVNIEEGNGE